MSKRDLRSMVGTAAEGVRRGAGLGGIIAQPEVAPAEEPSAPKVEREPISTRLPRGYKKRMMLLAVQQERDVQDLYEEAVRAYLEQNESAS